MSKLYDIANDLELLTEDVHRAERLLQSVCVNYFEKTKETTDPILLHSQYDMYTTIIFVASDMLWDTVKKYHEVIDTLFDHNKALKKLTETGT